MTEWDNYQTQELEELFSILKRDIDNQRKLSNSIWEELYNRKVRQLESF